LHELLTGSEVYVEPLRLPEKSPELLARLKKLKAEQDKAEYDRMVSNVDRKWNQSDGMQLGEEVRSGSKQLATIINFLLSIAATFAFGFIASQYAFPSLATVCNTDMCITTVFLDYFSLILTNLCSVSSFPCVPSRNGLSEWPLYFDLVSVLFAQIHYSKGNPPPP